MNRDPYSVRLICIVCEVCAKNGRPTPTKKVLLTHVNSEFNEEIQLDFFYATLRTKTFTVMTLTDTGTGLTELQITPPRKMDTILQTIEAAWTCQHGAPSALSADDEYSRKPLRNYLSAHSILFKPRPERRPNKIGKVGRKNCTVKAVLGKLDDEISDATPETLVSLSHAAFLSNPFSGNNILSSFEVVRVYLPAVVGIPKSMVTSELLDAHKAQAATSSLKCMLHARSPIVIQKELFKAGDPVWIFYNQASRTNRVNRLKQLWYLRKPTP